MISRQLNYLLDLKPLENTKCSTSPLKQWWKKHSEGFISCIRHTVPCLQEMLPGMVHAAPAVSIAALPRCCAGHGMQLHSSVSRLPCACRVPGRCQERSRFFVWVNLLLCFLQDTLIVIKTQQPAGKEHAGAVELSTSRGSGWVSPPAVLPLAPLAGVIRIQN